MLLRLLLAHKLLRIPSLFPGVAVGDMVIGRLSSTAEVAASPIIRARVTAANTVVIALISHWRYR